MGILRPTLHGFLENLAIKFVANRLLRFPVQCDSSLKVHISDLLCILTSDYFKSDIAYLISI